MKPFLQASDKLANWTICLFIRSTLAMNVLPFVQQHATAKTLFEALTYLYGDAGGIELVGGPAVFGTLDTALRRGRMTEPSVSKISEESVASPALHGVAVQRDSSRDLDPASGDPSTSELLLRPRQYPSPPTLLLPKPEKPYYIRSEKKQVGFVLPSSISSPPAHSHRQPWTPPPLTPAFIPACTITSTSMAARKASASPSSTTSAVSGLDRDFDFDFSYTSARKASLVEDVGTQIEMKSLATNEDFETPVEEKGDFFG